MSKELLAARQPSAETVNNLYHDTAFSDHLRNVMAYARSHANVDKLPVWFKREVLRLQYGIYQSSAVLDDLQLNCMASQFVPHVSTKDNTLIAYTPDATAGTEDKQIQMALGRFMRKVCALWSDTYIAEREAAHRAELSGTFERATTPEEIHRVYTTMEGDSGCMRRESSYWGLPRDIHPSMAYAAPGMAVAYTKDASGTIKARTVIWENPSDPTDKRYVRVYGDPALKRILERAGYRCHHLAGAKLNVVKYNDKFVMPYLDGPNGRQHEEDGSYVAFDGTDLIVLTREQAMAVNNNGRYDYAQRIKGHSGVTYYMDTMPSMNWTCALSGRVLSRFTDVPVNIWKDGRVQEAQRAAVVEQYPNALGVYVFDASASKRVSVFNLDDTPVFDGMFIDEPATREFRGYVQFSDDRSPEPRWVHAHLVHEVVRPSDRTVARRMCTELGVLLAEDGGSRVNIDMADVKEWRKLGFVNCAKVVGRPTLIHPSRTTARRSEGGTWFDVQLHRDDYHCLELEGGKWVHKRNASPMTMWGHRFYVSDQFRASAAPNTETTRRVAFAKSRRVVDMQNLIDGILADGFGGSVAGIEAAITAVETRLANTLADGYSVYYIEPETNVLRVASSWSRRTYAELKAAADMIREATNRADEHNVFLERFDIAEGWYAPNRERLLARQQQIAALDAGQQTIPTTETEEALA